MKIVFDTELMQPACPLLQAAMGGDPSVAQYFDSADWLTFPTEKMVLRELTLLQLDALRVMVKAYAEERAKEKALQA